MKLNFFHAKQNLDEGREEYILSANLGDDIPRPMGISAEEWTPSLKKHFKGIRDTNPSLYKKILMGH